jgi:hypothetical protein
MAERTVDLTDEVDVSLIQVLWNEEKLVSQTKDPLDLIRGASASFNATLFGYVRRMELLHQDLATDPALLDFLADKRVPAKDTLVTDLRFDRSLNTSEVLAGLKDIAVWFRSVFPYYYDNCLSCGNRANNTFVGYTRPNADERLSLAGRTELYSCGHCGNLSR